MLAKLQNNGLAFERKRGSMFEVRVGATYADAVRQFSENLQPWREAVLRTVDLMSRMDNRSAEVAASVHYTAKALTKRNGKPPTATQVLEHVEQWKANRKPPVTRERIADSIALLAMRKWIDVGLDAEFDRLLDQVPGT